MKLQTIALFLIIVFILIGCSISPSKFVAYPCHKINYADILTYSDKTIISGSYIKSLVLHTGSMLPAISDESTILYKIPQNEKEICVGDIIYYDTNEKCNDYPTILHRIISKNIDNEGVYFTTKGDNNGNTADACKIRINDVKFVVIGIIY